MSKKKKKKKFKNKILQNIQNPTLKEKETTVIEKPVEEKLATPKETQEKNIITINADDKKNFQSDFKKFIVSICIVGILFAIVVLLNYNTNIISDLANNLVAFLNIQS